MDGTAQDPPRIADPVYAPPARDTPLSLLAGA